LLGFGFGNTVGIVGVRGRRVAGRRQHLNPAGDAGALRSWHRQKHEVPCVVMPEPHLISVSNCLRSFRVSLLQVRLWRCAHLRAL
jgi:hypothetical protein